MAEAEMPKNIAQWTGFAVTMIIVLGRDADVLTAVPLGIAAGMLATLLEAATRMQLRQVRLLVPAVDLRRPVAAVARAYEQYRPKRRHAQFRE
jgi:hypothetical protein